MCHQREVWGLTGRSSSDINKVKTGFKNVNLYKLKYAFRVNIVFNSIDVCECVSFILPTQSVLERLVALITQSMLF